MMLSYSWSRPLQWGNSFFLFLTQGDSHFFFEYIGLVDAETQIKLESKEILHEVNKPVLYIESVKRKNSQTVCLM